MGRRYQRRSPQPSSPKSCRARRPQARPLFANLRQPCTAGLPIGDRPMRAWPAASSRWPESPPRRRRTSRPNTPPRPKRPTDRNERSGDLVHDLGRQALELLLDVFRGFRPYAVGVRIIGAPHQRFDPDVVDELGADPIELEGRAALPAPVFARLEVYQIAEPILILEIHAVERVGEPADAALAETDAEVRIAFEHPGADDRGDDVDQVHLKTGDVGELRLAAEVTGQALAHAGRHRREGMEVQRQLHVVDGFPQWL